MIFYIGVIVVIGLLLFYIDLYLFVGEVIDVVVSLFMLVLKWVGVVVVVVVMNVVIFILVFLVGNFGFYVFI